MKVGALKLGLILLAAGCLEPPSAPPPLSGGPNTPMERELAALRTETSALRAENTLLRSQLLGYEPWADTLQLAPVGGSGGVVFTRVCPAGHGLIGLRGRSGALIDSIGPVCAPLNLPEVPLGSDVGPVRTELEMAGGTGGAPFDTTCPRNQVAVGMRGHAGNILSGVRLICRPVGADGLQAPEPVAEGTAEGTGVEGTGEAAPTHGRSRRRNRGEESPAVGGQEGTPFTRSCPPGWLAMGLSGHGGAMIDQISLHCGRLSPAPPNP